MKPLLRIEAVVEFTLRAGHLRWPWVTFSPSHTAMVYPVESRTVAVRTSARPNDEMRFELAEGFDLPREREASNGTTSRQQGLHALAVHDDGRSVVAFAWDNGAPRACVASTGEAPRVVDLSAALGELGPMSATFARHGDALWLSAESSKQAKLVRLAWPSLDATGEITFTPPPLPAHHELFVHPTHDQAMLLMACGQDGTFVQVAGTERGQVVRVPNRLEGGGEPSGFADMSLDGARVFLVGDSGLAAHAWPTLETRTHIEATEGLVFNYTGIRFGDRVLVSAVDEEDEDTARALAYDENTLALRDDAPAPKGMWAGRLGDDMLVVVGAEKATTRVVRVHRLAWTSAEPSAGGSKRS